MQSATGLSELDKHQSQSNYSRVKTQNFTPEKNITRS